MYSKLPPVLPPIFWVSIPIRQPCSTAKSVWSSAITLALAADEVFDGSVELDESYFGGRRKGRRGRGAAGKVVVFGILKRNGRVYTVVMDDAKSDTLMTVIKQKIMPDSIVYTDSLSSYNKLDVSGFTITASTIPRNLQTARTTLTALKTFRIRRNASYANTTELIVNLSRCS